MKEKKIKVRLSKNDTSRVIRSLANETERVLSQTPDAQSNGHSSRREAGQLARIENRLARKLRRLKKKQK